MSSKDKSSSPACERRDARPPGRRVEPDTPEVSLAGTIWAFAAVCVLGGAIGGRICSASMSDRIGRSKTMIITILFYSLFTCRPPPLVESSAANGSYPALLRRDGRGRRMGGRLGHGGGSHAASFSIGDEFDLSMLPRVFGTLLAAAAGAFIVGNPAHGENLDGGGDFAIGAVPSTVAHLVDPLEAERTRAMGESQRTSRADNTDEATWEILGALFVGPDNLRNTLVGVSLASIGLATFWGMPYIRQECTAFTRAKSSSDGGRKCPSLSTFDQGNRQSKGRRRTDLKQNGPTPINELRKDHMFLSGARQSKRIMSKERTRCGAWSSTPSGEDWDLILFGRISNRIGTTRSLYVCTIWSDSAWCDLAVQVPHSKRTPLKRPCWDSSSSQSSASSHSGCTLGMQSTSPNSIPHDYAWNGSGILFQSGPSSHCGLLSSDLASLALAHQRRSTRD